MFTRFEKILLFGGGIDSYVAYHYLKKPQTVYFNLGHKYAQKERIKVQQLIPTTIIDRSIYLGDIEQKDSHILYRNLFLVLLASAKYSDNIYLCGVKDDRVEDNNKDFYARASELMSLLSGRKITVSSPFIDMTKDEVVKLYLKHYGTTDDLLATYSCFSEIEMNYCGKCPACFRKWIVLRNNGLKIDFYNEELIEEYRQKCLKGVYDPDRARITLGVIDEYLC
jgi:7-cyano-7-deazaguanine synthase